MVVRQSGSAAATARKRAYSCQINHALRGQHRLQRAVSCRGAESPRVHESLMRTCAAGRSRGHTGEKRLSSQPPPPPPASRGRERITCAHVRTSESSAALCAPKMSAHAETSTTTGLRSCRVRARI